MWKEFAYFTPCFSVSIVNFEHANADWVDDNVQELPTEKSEDLILLKERIKYLESESKFLKDIFNKQNLIDKLLENNNELVYHKSYHVPLQYVKVAKVVLSMEADLPLTINTSRLIIIDLTVYWLNRQKIKIRIMQKTMVL